MDGDYEGNHCALLLLSDRRWIYAWVPQCLSWSHRRRRSHCYQLPRDPMIDVANVRCWRRLDDYLEIRESNSPPASPLRHMVRSAHPEQVSVHHYARTPPRSASLTV
ncbi:hypothetical protein ACFX13_042812 [Malus domestica]